MPRPAVLTAFAASCLAAVSASLLDTGLDGVPHPHLNFFDERSTSGCSSSDSSDDTTAMKLVTNMQGRNFFDYWDFFTWDDPTHGQVDYISKDEAMSNKPKLAYVNSKGHAIVRVDPVTDLSMGEQRKSVRITSKSPLTKGQMVVMAADHMPTGCATWPAFWTVGANWPYGGEIDIVEGVNQNTRNQMTLHTGDGCTLKTPMQATGTPVNTRDCYAYATSNEGCGVKDETWGSYGAGFNQNGGTWAMLWDDDGIKIWFFRDSNIPWDLRRARPVPSTWGKPVAFYDASTCDMDSFFSDQTIVINTTLCGDWAGNAWVFATQCPGTCEGWVRYGDNFKQAYWEIRSVRIYETQ